MGTDYFPEALVFSAGYIIIVLLGALVWVISLLNKLGEKDSRRESPVERCNRCVHLQGRTNGHYCTYLKKHLTFAPEECKCQKI